MKKLNITIFVPILFLVWAGELVGLSFIATPAKFLAKEFTMVELLSVGKVTFHTQVIVEWIFISLTAIAIIFNHFKNNFNRVFIITFVIVVILFIIQYYFIMPILDNRLNARQAGIKLEYSPIHQVFVGMEFAKIIILIIGSYKNLNK